MKVDYLIVGAGASGLAFLDVILTETEATVAIVDRRDAPGGHWNDAYPFVRLHQSSSFYGVPSKNLGQDRITPRGYNAGLFELASKNEILHYYEDLMETQYLPSGRVTYFPMSEYRDGAVCSLLTGEKTPIEVVGKTVQAGTWGDLSSIPSTHTRSFAVDDDVSCIPPNDLPRQAPSHDKFTVLGAGKTAMDAVLWLLARNVTPDDITWVRPNDYWIFQREQTLPHPDFFDQSIGSMTADLESLATSRTVKEHCLNLEACGRWLRIDPDVWPERFHAAVCSSREIEALRRVTDVVRAGHVISLHSDRMVLQGAAHATPDLRLYVDCTARGGVPINRPDMKVFDGDVINLAMVRPFQPVFSAALIAHLEACVPDEDLRQQATGITDFFDTPALSLIGQRQGFINQHVWNQTPVIKDWLDRCRLNAGFHLLRGLRPDDADKMQKLGRLGPLTAAAVENIPDFLPRRMGEEAHMTDFPAPGFMHPVKLADGTAHKGTVFLRAALDHPRIEVGEYTYASAHTPPDDWAAYLAPYLYDVSPERLVIGRFCQIADGVTFVTASANHRYDGISSFPFAVFGDGPREGRPSMPGPGADTVIGNDVWIGQGARILPGARIGDGVIIGSGAVVAGQVADYAIVAGNPAKVIRQRFSQADVVRLRRIAWWHWPIDRILANEALIAGNDVSALEAVTP